jgi:transcriptional regulator with XRE-family HTH domain
MAKDPDLLAVGARIQLARERAGLGQKELAEAVGVTARAIGGYEAGAINPKMKLRALAEQTGVSWEWLSYGDDGPPGSEAGGQDSLSPIRLGMQEVVRAMTRVMEELDRFERRSGD